MAEFFDAKEKIVNVGESVVFENKTDSSFDVSTGIVFHKSGIYEVSILENRTVISKITERKTGKWIPIPQKHGWTCSVCGKENVYAYSMYNNFDFALQDYYCPNCGATMEVEHDE